MFNETEFNEVEYNAVGPDGLSDSPYYFDFFEYIKTLSPEVYLARSLTTNEVLGISDDFNTQIGISILNVLQFEAVLTDQVTTEVTFSELLKIKDNQSFTFSLEFSELFNVNGELSFTRNVVIDFLESLVVSGEVDSLRRAVMLLSEVFSVAADMKFGGYLMNLAENLGISVDSTASYRAIVSALESIVLGDTQDMTARVVVSFDEEIDISDAMDSKARMVLALEAGIEFGGVLNTTEGVFEAWVVNVQTKAPWQYDNYPFNSFAKDGVRYLALSSTGLYELSGDTDDGDIISATIKTGLDDFGTARMKSIPMAYFGYTSNGRVLFKTITTESGEKTERWYELKERTANSTTDARVKMGRGVRSVYWQFEIENIDGADFDFDSVKLLPAVLKRRV